MTWTFIGARDYDVAGFEEDKQNIPQLHLLVYKIDYRYVRKIRFISFTKQKPKAVQYSNYALKINQTIEVKT